MNIARNALNNRVYIKKYGKKCIRIINIINVVIVDSFLCFIAPYTMQFFFFKKKYSL